VFDKFHHHFLFVFDRLAFGLAALFFGILAPDLRASENAIATACFWFLFGLECISSEIFSEITFFDLPDFKGMPVLLICEYCKIQFSVKPYMAKTARCCSQSCLWHVTKSTREPKRLAAIRGKKAANNGQIQINCHHCKNPFSISPSRLGKKKFCTQDCYTLAMTTNNISTHLKYKRVTVDGVRMHEHRYVMQCHLGRKLLRTEHVHHKNHNTLDNRLENLEVLDIREHAKTHARKPF